MDLSAIPLLDHHCHSLLPEHPAGGAEGFRRWFSESADEAMAPHLRHSLFYRRGLRDLATLLECDPTEEAVLAARDAASPAEHAHRLLGAANLRGLFVDMGLLADQTLSLESLRGLTGATVREVLRLETLMEQCIRDSVSYDEWTERYRSTLLLARENGVVAFKSIAAYRGGLAIPQRQWLSERDGERSFEHYRERYEHGEPVRVSGLSHGPLRDVGLTMALEIAAELEMPVQFHTGFGDDDLRLRGADPLQLQSLIREPAFRRIRFVLLHCWPFVREAGYLAGLYANVYVDLGLTVPFCAHGGASAIREALEQASSSKLLLSTDAFGIPERFYLGALYARRELSRALESLVNEDWLTWTEADAVAKQLLRENAEAAYG